jgi:hypothetical protein
MISTSDSGVDAAVDEATYVSVSGTGFTPGSRLEVNCEGDPNWFMLTTADDSGSFDSVQSVCWHSADFPQVIAVRDATGREASQLSDW